MCEINYDDDKIWPQINLRYCAVELGGGGGAKDHSGWAVAVGVSSWNVTVLRISVGGFGVCMPPTKRGAPFGVS